LAEYRILRRGHVPHDQQVHACLWRALLSPAQSYFNDDLYTSFNPSAYNPGAQKRHLQWLVVLAWTQSQSLPANSGGMPGPNRALWNNNNHMFAPRLSFAYDPTGKGKWAIRAGAGQFFNRDRLYALRFGGANPPFIGNFTTTNGRFADSITQPGACARPASARASAMPPSVARPAIKCSQQLAI